MAEIPAGRIGHSSEVYVYTGSNYAKNATTFADRTRSREGTETNWPQFYPPGRGEDLYGWRGYVNQPNVWQKVGRIRDISGPEPSVNEVEVTSNDSPLNYKEFIPGLKDGGTVSFDMVYDVRDATQTGAGANSLETMFEDGDTRRFAIRLPTYRIGDRITDVTGSTVTLTAAAAASGGATGYTDVGTSINAFKNQAFHLFAGFVMRLGNEIPMEEAIMRNVEFKVTGRVESPALAVATSTTTTTAIANRYVVTRTSNTGYTAAHFTSSTVGPFASNHLRLPTWSGDRYLGIAIPDSEGTPDDIFLGGGSTDTVTQWTAQSGTITLESTDYKVFVSNATFAGNLFSGMQIQLNFN